MTYMIFKFQYNTKIYIFLKIAWLCFNFDLQHITSMSLGNSYSMLCGATWNILALR